jgi:hypothetical protein
LLYNVLMRVPPGEVTGPIAPYLQRAHWGGSVIGEALAAFAIGSLEAALVGGVRHKPVQTYQPGSAAPVVYPQCLHGLSTGSLKYC